MGRPFVGKQSLGMTGEEATKKVDGDDQRQDLCGKQRLGMTGEEATMKVERLYIS